MTQAERLVPNPSVTDFAGFGLGLRPAHFHDVLHNSHPVDWFEVISENFFVAGGKPRYYLSQIRERYPVALHGVSLSIGTRDPLDLAYLGQLKALIDEVKPVIVSDHMCWTSGGGHNSHDLLPLPYTEEVVVHLIERINQVQDFLGRQIVLENVSAYVAFQQSELQEWEFLNAVANGSGCGLLLDVNNIYVNERNLGINASNFLNNIEGRHIQQIHVAGHSDYGSYVIDTHDAPIRPEVFELFRAAFERFGPINTMIERDDHIPEFAVLVDELNQLRSYAAPSLDAGDAGDAGQNREQLGGS